MFPNLTAELLRRGYSQKTVGKVISGNIMRVLQAAEATAAALQVRAFRYAFAYAHPIDLWISK